MFAEDDYLQLSGIQHFAFCKRQWGLVYLELQWIENLRTAEGRIVHERAHDSFFTEKRGDLIISRGIQVSSKELGISGECDVAEFHKAASESAQAVYIPEYDGCFTVVPVEYKRGTPKTEEYDMLQLCAQALCLEEMLCVQIPEGYIYYAETKRRRSVEFTGELRDRVKSAVMQMHDYSSRGITPSAKRTKSSNACSVKDICLPQLEKKKSAADYIRSAISDTET